MAVGKRRRSWPCSICGFGAIHFWINPGSTTISPGEIVIRTCSLRFFAMVQPWDIPFAFFWFSVEQTWPQEAALIGALARDLKHVQGYSNCSMPATKSTGTGLTTMICIWAVSKTPIGWWFYGIIYTSQYTGDYNNPIEQSLSTKLYLEWERDVVSTAHLFNATKDHCDPPNSRIPDSNLGVSGTLLIAMGQEVGTYCMCMARKIVIGGKVVTDDEFIDWLTNGN